MNTNAVTLEGVWQEDVEKTLEWNEIHTRISDEDLKKLATISGHMWVSYDAGRWCLFHEPYSHHYNGKKKDITRFATTFGKYKIVAKNKFELVIESNLSSNDENIDMITFEKKDSIYVTSLTTEDFGLPGHRMYFKRVEPVKWNFDCE